MATQISGDTGVSQVQDGIIKAQDLGGGTGTGNLTQYTTATTPLPATSAILAVNHSLGVIPTDVEYELTCLVAEQGYSIGDVVQARNTWNGTTINAPNLWKSTTQVGFYFGSVYTTILNHKTAGTAFTPTAANWSYRFRLRAA